MAFRFERSTFPVSAGVEDYQVVEVPGGCELRWTARLSGFAPLTFLIHFLMKRGLGQGLPKLEKLIQSDPARFGI